MASNVSTVDGMGFEEVNQLSFTDMVSGTSGCFMTIDADAADITNIATAGILASAIIGGNISAVGSVVDNKGRLQSSLLGSATTNVWGAYAQVGSLSTNTGSQGFIKFGTPYSSSTSYYVVTTACGSATGFEQSYISGLRNASGANFVGAASLRYDWVAFGI